VPVVVGPDHDEVDVAVRTEVQHLTGEPGPVGKVQSRELSTCRHVADALVDVVAAGPHLFEPGRVHVEHLRRFSRDRVESEISSGDVAVVPLLGTVVLLDDAGRRLSVAVWHVPFEHVRGLADVIVDGDEDQVVDSHRCPLCGSRRPYI
jgi:hypothetical protein